LRGKTVTTSADAVFAGLVAGRRPGDGASIQWAPVEREFVVAERAGIAVEWR